MDKRLPLASVLIILVLFGVPLLFPRPPVPVRSAGADTTTVRTPVPDAAVVHAVPVAPGNVARAAAPPEVAPDTIMAKTALSTTWFSTLGAGPLSVQADSYPALNGRGGRVVLRHAQEPLLRFRVITPTDTIALDRMTFTATKSNGTNGAAVVTFAGSSGAHQATIRYDLANDNYLSTIAVNVTGTASPAFLLVDLPGGFDTQETDTLGDMRALAYAVKPVTQSARGTAFAKLDSGEKKLEPGPLTWAVAKSKYFLVGLLQPVGGKPFAEAHLEGGVRTRKQATNAFATVVIPLHSGRATFEMYAGPQSWRRLHDLGREFETANPYGGGGAGGGAPVFTGVMRGVVWGDEGDHAPELGMGVGDFRRGGAPAHVAAEPGRDAHEPQDAAHPARAHRSAEEVQERPAEAAGGDHAGVQGTRDEPVQRVLGVSADADPDARVLRAVLRVPEHDRVPRRAVPLAARHLAARSVLHPADRDGRVSAPVFVDGHA